MKKDTYKNKATFLEKLKTKSKREANLFFSLCEDNSEIINTKKFKEVKDAKLELVWEPPWDKSMMSEAAKLELNL